MLALCGCSDEKKKEAGSSSKQAEPPPLAVEVVTVKKQPVPIWLEYTAKTEASQRIEVRARAAGRLEKILFKEGDLVKKGQKLFEIEKASYQAEVAKAKATLAKDKASLKLAIADVNRYKPLVEKGLAPRATLEQYMAQEMELKATIKADEAAIEEAELNLSYTDVLSPIDGRISRRQVDVGNIVGYSEQTVLTTIVADDPMYAYFNPTEEDVQVMQKYRDQEQMDARVRVPTKDPTVIERDTYSGKVDFTDNRVDRMTGTITMRAVVENPDNSLLEGTFVYAEIFVTRKGQFLMVSPGIVTEDQRGSYLYTVDDSNQAKRVYVKRGHEGRYYLDIEEGLEDGDRVVMNGLSKMRDGLKVEPTDVTDTKGVLAVLKSKNMIPKAN
jgi:RND family efflux transporter MFP subunit